MCWMCDHPNATRQDYLKHLRSIITEVGWAVQAVEGGRNRAPYAYTVGLSSRGKPELVVTGMAAYRAAKLLNEVAVLMLHATVPEPGEQVSLIGGPLIEFVEVERPSVHLGVACQFYGTKIRACKSCTPTITVTGRGSWDTGAGAAVSPSSATDKACSRSASVGRRCVGPADLAANACGQALPGITQRCRRGTRRLRW